jgi:O-antigen/teichoic acid export membrane protein
VAGVFFSADTFAAIKIAELHDYALAIPLGVLVFGSFQIATHVAIREQRFGGLALARFATGSSLAVTHTTLGLLSLGPIGLIVGQIGSHFLAQLTLVRPVLKLVRSKNQTCARLLKVAKRYSNFPKYSAPAGVLNVATVRAPAALFTMLYGTAVGGSFLFCQTVLAAPTVLFGRAIGQVYLSIIATRRRERKADIASFFLRMTSRLAIIALIPSIFIATLGPRVFVFIFGENWSLAGQFSRLLAFVVFAQFVIVPIGQTLEILERQPLQLAWDLMRFVGVVAVILVSYQLEQQAISAVTWYVCFLFISYLVFYAIVLSACISHDRAANTK